MIEKIDPVLAESGNKKIEWVRLCMPVLFSLEKRFEKEKPLRGLRVSVSVHLEAKTANLCLLLQTAGAEVAVTGCNPLSTQDDVAHALAARGFRVAARHGASMEEYHEHLCETLSIHPHVMVDDGGDFTAILHGDHPEYADCLIGGCEETTTGIHRLKARQKAGALHFPMFAVNDANSKHLFDNRYGTGQSSWDAIMHMTNMVVAGKNVVVAGYGFCGKGIAMRAKGLGARVIVTEVDPFCALEANMDGFRVMKMDDAAPIGDIFICATGCKDVLVGRHFDRMKDGVLIANSGHFDVEANKEDLARNCTEIVQRKPGIQAYIQKDGRALNLLAEGRLVNLAGGNGHPAEIMDMSFGIQALCVERMALEGKDYECKLYDVPEDIDRQVAWLKAEASGLGIDKLTPEQEAYLGGYEG